MPDGVVVDKEKFDRLLKKTLDTSPLPKSEIKVSEPQAQEEKTLGAAEFRAFVRLHVVKPD